MRIKLLFSCILTTSLLCAYANAGCVTNNPETSGKYNATKWYRNSAEKNAQYNQIFALGLEKITVKAKTLKKGTWGVIVDIDETVLDNSEYEKENVLNCTSYTPEANYAFMDKGISTATPGSKKLTCSIQKLGGKVILVTNRNGNFDDKIKNVTIANLEKEGICFNNVLFAKSETDINKNPRFNAVRTGDYSNVLAIKKIPAVKVIAYFGDNIQDFPNITQKNAIKQDPNGTFYQKFGQEYFSLPNPTYGSWENNQFN